MKKKPASDLCPFCRGAKRPGTTTFTAELGFGVVVVRRVPASVCGQCGADWISDKVAGKLEALVVDHPDYALAHAALGVFYGKLGRQDEAVEHAQRVCELEPDDPFSFMALSMICQKAGLRSEAEKALGEAMDKQWAAKKTR